MKRCTIIWLALQHSGTMLGGVYSAWWIGENTPRTRRGRTWTMPILTLSGWIPASKNSTYRCPGKPNAVWPRQPRALPGWLLNFPTATSPSGPAGPAERKGPPPPRRSAIIPFAQNRRRKFRRSELRNLTAPRCNSIMPRAQKSWKNMGIAARCRADQWAVRDSNPRHPRCKHGALTN